MRIFDHPVHTICMKNNQADIHNLFRHTALYGLYFASSKAVDFPFTFKEAPLIIVSPGTTNELYWMGVNEVSTTGYKLTAYSVKKGMCYSQGNMLIIGKWK